MFSFAFLSLFCNCLLILVLKSYIYYKYVLRPIRCIDVKDLYELANPFAFCSTVRSGHNLGGWRCRLSLSMLLLTISVGRIWSVQSVLEFNAIKKKLRIMSDKVRVFWTLPYGFSRVFVLYS